MEEQQVFKENTTSTYTQTPCPDTSSCAEPIAASTSKIPAYLLPHLSMREQVDALLKTIPKKPEKLSPSALQMKELIDTLLKRSEERRARAEALKQNEAGSKLPAPSDSTNAFSSKNVLRMETPTQFPGKLYDIPLKQTTLRASNDLPKELASSSTKPIRERSSSSDTDSESTKQEAKRVCPTIEISEEIKKPQLFKADVLQDSPKKFEYIESVDTTAEQTQLVKFNRLNIKNQNPEISLLAVLGQSGIEIFETRTTPSRIALLQIIRMHRRHLYISCDWSESKDHKFSPRLAIGSDSGTVSMVIIKFEETYTFDYRPNIFLFKNNSIEQVLFHPSDENLLFITQLNVISCCNIRTKICAFSIHRHDYYNLIKSIDIDKSGKYLASSSFASNLITVWNVDINDAVIKEHVEKSYGTCSKDEQIEDFLDASTNLNDYNGSFIIKESICQHTEHTGTVDCIKWYGGVIISKDQHGSLIVWELESTSVKSKEYFILTKIKIDTLKSVFNMFFDVNYEHRMMALANHASKIFVWDLSVPVFEQLPRYDIVFQDTGSCMKCVTISRCGKEIISINRSHSCLWRFNKID